jgi:hypothetical protein
LEHFPAGSHLDVFNPHKLDEIYAAAKQIPGPYGSVWREWIKHAQRAIAVDPNRGAAVKTLAVAPESGPSHMESQLTTPIARKSSGLGHEDSSPDKLACATPKTREHVRHLLEFGESHRPQAAPSHPSWHCHGVRVLSMIHALPQSTQGRFAKHNPRRRIRTNGHPQSILSNICGRRTKLVLNMPGVLSSGWIKYERGSKFGDHGLPLLEEVMQSRAKSYPLTNSKQAKTSITSEAFSSKIVGFGSLEMVILSSSSTSR